MPKGSDEFVRISAIPMTNLEDIKSWLNDVVDMVRC